MNIVILSCVFPPEPVVSAKLSYDIASELSHKNTVTVISPTPSRPLGFKFSNESIHFNFKHVQLDSFSCASSSFLGRFKESYSFGKHCSRYISDNHQNIDFIYANSWPLFGQYYAVKAAKKYKIPIIVHVQDIYPESISQLLPFVSFFINAILMPLDKYILGNANKIIAISQKMKVYLEKTRKLDGDKIKVVSNWQDEQTFTGANKQPSYTDSNIFTFMYLGNIGPVAGVELLLNAFAMAHLKNSRLVIAGSGSMKKNLLKQVENYPDCNIEFWIVPEGKVAELQSIANVFLLPVKKGFASTSIPSELPAYMFSSRPIIASVDADSDTAFAINKAECGWIVEPENIKKLSTLMIEISTIPAEIMRAKGINGKNYAMINYSKRNNLPNLITIINETIPSKI